MQRFLAIYLLVTGAAAGAVLLVPSLVIIGLFLLIIPGLLLGLAPTAFLWGCVFAAAWWILRAFASPAVAVVLAALLTAAVVLGVNAPQRAAGRRVLEASLLPELLPADRLAPTGDVRLDLVAPRLDNKNPQLDGSRRPFSCDNLCVALLFTPGVTSVTVNDSSDFTVEDHRNGTGQLARQARTFRLVPKDRCAGQEHQVDLEGMTGLFGTFAERQAVSGLWNLRLSSESCITSGPPLARYDMLIRNGRYLFPPRSEDRSAHAPARGQASVDYVEIRDGSGSLLLRRLLSRVPVLARLLYAEPTGSLSNFHWRWGQEQLSSGGRHAELNFLDLLQKQTTLGEQSAPADLLPRIRAALKQAVDDPTRSATDPTFKTVRTYLEEIGGGPISDEDVRLIDALIADERLTDYPGVHALLKASADRQRRIADAMLRRILSTDDPLELRNSGFSNFLAKSAPGTFATLSPDQLRLLARPDRRIAAPGLISRLSDGGTASLPALMAILREHGVALQFARQAPERKRPDYRIIEAQGATIDAVRIALCRLGPAAAPVLPQLREMIVGGIIPERELEGFGGMNWNITLARLGAPVESLNKPKSMSGSDQSHRDTIRRRLARLDPDRDCDR